MVHAIVNVPSKFAIEKPLLAFSIPFTKEEVKELLLHTGARRMSKRT
jgi:hypothetical protein